MIFATNHKSQVAPIFVFVAMVDTNTVKKIKGNRYMFLKDRES